MSIEICCNICCDNYCKYHFGEFDTWQYLWISIYLTKTFIKFLSYIDCTGIMPIGIDMCLMDVCVFLWHISNEISLVLVVLCIQLSLYNMLCIIFFHTLLIHLRSEWSTYPCKELCEIWIAIFWWGFPKVWIR
jgi:hypothetical protein